MQLKNNAQSTLTVGRGDLQMPEDLRPTVLGALNKDGLIANLEIYLIARFYLVTPERANPTTYELRQAIDSR
ncbi:MAG: hypothetical protein KAS38_01385 [Anaerolineales bacterium]|nr:hypothetical protein [Anaerolineales bacterium]